MHHLLLIIYHVVIVIALQVQCAPEWSFDVNVYNKETKEGTWDFMDEDVNERSRHAVIGDVYIRQKAPANATILGDC